MRESCVKNQVVLVTGGTGSFGRSFIRKILQKQSPSKVIIFSRDEWKQLEMQQSDPLFRDERLRYFLGDVRDRDRLMRAFRGVDLVIHAAALKQIPPAEYNPSEYVKTNVIGAMNIIDAAIERGVQKVVALSTDKAANPVNLYGATKLCSDKLFVAGNVYVGHDQVTRFSVVRYGNVLGSRGSVIPYWRQLLADGAKRLPITDLRMTRFWITLDQAIDLVLLSLDRMLGGEIFVPKIPSCRMIDLMEAMAPEATPEVVGIREGEKLHEMLIGSEDSRSAREFDDHFEILPPYLEKRGVESYFACRQGKVLPEGFAYSSDQNGQWLAVEQLRDLLSTLQPK
jgi:UDP-N-acetylglucosamine 4,6-dehydratase/5-epimerase